MRKTVEVLLLTLTVLLFITAFVSCKRNEAQAEKTAAARLSKPFSCTAQVTLNGKSYGINFARPSAGDCTMSFTKPSELTPLSFELKSGNLKIKYGEIETAVDPSAIPQSAIVNAVLGAFDAAGGASDLHASVLGKNVQISGNMATGSFKMTLNKDCTPKELSIPSLKLKADFNNFQYL